MRNNGSTPWPQGLQLVWIGGDKFSDSVLAEIQVPVGGVPVNGELDIAVDFTAPAAPGRYISYWRMSSPTGFKFGQRVWVLIQVDASRNESLCDGFQGLNLNFPPGSTGPKTFDVNVNPEVNTSVETVEPIVDEVVPTRDEDVNFPINDSLLVGNAIAASAPLASSSILYPYIDLSDATIPDEPLNTESPGNDAEEVEQSLLKELEQMGFKEINLNKEVLRMNQYDLEKSVDDLCGVIEWDPILDELMEMGFVDAETNKKLLKKNNGSIKRVVMDLLSEQKS
jgi:next-to-BRCA1 protein 1